jgi:hypothetical protein
MARETRAMVERSEAHGGRRRAAQGWSSFVLLSIAGCACGVQAPGGLTEEGPDSGHGQGAASLVRLFVQAVDRCPVDPPVSPGLARSSPTAARVGLQSVALLRSRTDPQPAQLELAGSGGEVELITGARVAEGWVPAGEYRWLRYELSWAAVEVPATAHIGGVAVSGSLSFDVALAPHLSDDGTTRGVGELRSRFTAAAGGLSRTATAVVPLDCPLSAAGGLVDTGSGRHAITVPIPGGSWVADGGEAAGELVARFPLAGAVTWIDRASTGFVTGRLDIASSPEQSETPARLPICDLLLSDRCDPEARPPRTTPGWPMPDSSTLACTDGTAVASCPATGQPGAGQDGTYSIHPPRYLVEEAAVRDEVTGLLWQRHPPPEPFDWWEARAYCDRLVLAGREDWSLPSRLELVSLLDVGRFGPSIDLAAFPEAPAEFFWTSSPAMFSSLAFGVRFDQGFVYDHDPRESGRVRCVADGQPGPAERFQVSPDTVRDGATGLIWQRGIHSPRPWLGALEACEDLSLGDALDWRLPSLKELLTLVDEYALNPSTDLAAFPDTPAEWLWASTPGFAPPDYAQTVSFTDGFCTPAAVEQLYVFRCVRGP